MLYLLQQEKLAALNKRKLPEELLEQLAESSSKKQKTVTEKQSSGNLQAVQTSSNIFALFLERMNYLPECSECQSDQGQVVMVCRKKIMVQQTQGVELYMCTCDTELISGDYVGASWRLLHQKTNKKVSFCGHFNHKFRSTKFVFAVPIVCM